MVAVTGGTTSAGVANVAGGDVSTVVVEGGTDEVVDVVDVDVVVLGASVVEVVVDSSVVVVGSTVVVVS